MPKSNIPLSALITGGASGLGKEITLLLVKEGYEVHVWDINSKALQSLKDINCDINIYQVDLSDPQQITHAKKLVLKNSPSGIGLVIANAGIGAVNPGTSYSSAINEKVMMINSLGAMNTLTAFLPEMIKNNSGHLVAISSLASLRGVPAGASYSASKAALNNFIESLALDLKRNNIHTTTILPGFIKTPMVEHSEFPTPFCIPVNVAAQKCLSAIKKKRTKLLFPLPMVILSSLNKLIPSFIYLWLMPFIGPKPAKEARVF